MFNWWWKKESANEKTKQAHKSKGEKENKEEKTKSPATDDWAAFKQLCVSSGSQTSQKEMLGSPP